MADQERKLCDVCRERPASRHTCYGSTGETRELCITCFEQTASHAELEFFRLSMDVVRNGKCRWCGAPAVGGMTGLGIPEVMEEQSNLWCEPCRLDLVEFDSRPENEMTDFPFDDEAAQAILPQQLQDYEHRKTEFMAHRVTQRAR